MATADALERRAQNVGNVAAAAAAKRLAGQAAAIQKAQSLGTYNSKVYGPASPSTTPRDPYASSGVSNSDPFVNSNVDPGALVSSAPTQEDYLKSDPVLAAQNNALETALRLLESKNAADKQLYNVDYGKSLRNLGFTGDSNALEGATYDAAQNSWIGADKKPLSLSWDMNDVNTASGRGINNARNDFAARGMLHSSAYNRALTNLMRSLNEQLSANATAKATFEKGLTDAYTAKQAENTAAQGVNSANAIDRWRAQYGITG